ncbi:MAG TPA: hypothetical protein PLA72_10895, partial [Smithellaceae bacterium]|nr:hypothetical protein [Smithellaceae bacterium]
YIWAHCCAKRAAVTFFFLVCTNWAVSLSVIFFAGDDMSVGAEMNAEVTFFAEFSVYFYESFQNDTF